MRARRVPMALGVLALALGAGLVVWPKDSALSESLVRGEWVARYDGPVGGSDGARALAVDGSGNVYVTGGSSGTDDDYATVKHGPDGSEEWVARYDGPASQEDYAEALAVDGSGNVYVTGRSEGSGTSHDYATIKCGPDGTELWVARYDGPASLTDEARALAVDSAGNVYVTGQSYGSVNDPDYATVKYGPDGSELWAARYDGPGHSDDYAYALALDGSGNVYVTGLSAGSGTSYDYATIKYGPDGSEQWVARYDGPASGWDWAYTLALDGSGYAYVTGWSCDYYLTECDYATIKYGPDGSEEWVARYDGPAGEYDFAFALALDGAGNVYVTGMCDDSTFMLEGGDYATIKYGPDGSELWVARYDGPAGSGDMATELALDGAGNVYVTGGSYGSGTDWDYATIKYGPDGSKQWVARYDGPASDYDWAYALALDGAGNVYVTGESRGPGTDYDYATIKYAPVPPGDTDGDGCTNKQENGADPRRGGQRDYLDFWDYGDMPDPNATPQRDGMIRIGDLVEVLFRYGEDGDPGIDPLSTPPKTGYHTAYDRGDWVGPNPWNMEPPNGTIRVPDIVFVLMQYGHDCAE